MKKLQILFACFLLLWLAGCASTKNEGAEAFRNYSAKQLLAEGEQYLGKHSYTDAAKRFEALDALYPFDAETPQGDLDAIYAYYKSDDYNSALASADRYIHLYPQGQHTDYAYYMKGLINFERDRTWLQKLYPKDPQQLDLSNLRAAFVDFNDLIRLFPDSAYAHDAQLRMIYIRDLMAQRELEVAKFYYSRKAYVAAANRASIIVKHYQGSPVVADALKIMVDSYTALGDQKQANDALRVLQINYPNKH